MKKLLTKLTVLSGVILLILSACKKDESQAVLDLKSNGTFKASATSLTLKKDDAANNAVTFDFTEPNYGYKAAPNNVIQIALDGSNFANPKEIILDPNVLTKNLTVMDFNAILLSLGLPTSVDSKIQARLKSQLTDQVGLTYSNVISMTVNPFALTSYLYVPGAYQGWNPPTAQSLISPLSDGIYTGVINFTDGNLEFKVLTIRNWGPPEYGKGATDGTIAVGGGNLTAPKSGSQKLTVNTTLNTITFEDYSFGIIGSATPGGWSTDTPMAYDNASQTWSITLPLVAGQFKFRLNKDWTVGYGGKDGVLNQLNDNNINLDTAGTYKVSFSIPDSKYVITKQ
jgi:hypothetical protein